MRRAALATALFALLLVLQVDGAARRGRAGIGWAALAAATQLAGLASKATAAAGRASTPA